MGQRFCFWYSLEISMEISMELSRDIYFQGYFQGDTRGFSGAWEGIGMPDMTKWDPKFRKRLDRCMMR
jgi:hypothetical protein